MVSSRRQVRICMSHLRRLLRTNTLKGLLRANSSEMMDSLVV